MRRRRRRDVQPSTDAPSGTRTVIGSRGPVEVPSAPARIAALVGSADIDVMVLGLTPVFAGTFAGGWVDLPASIVTSDLVPPDPEAVAAATPDLLIGWDWLVDDADVGAARQDRPGDHPVRHRQLA